MTDLAAIRPWHVQDSFKDEGGFVHAVCRLCRGEWPCHASILLALLADTPSVEPAVDERWQMVEKDGGYVIAEVDSGRELTTTPIGEREAVRLAASYNVMAHSAGLRPSVEPPAVSHEATSTTGQANSGGGLLPTQASDSPEKT